MFSALFIDNKSLAQQKPTWQNKSFAVYADSIVQGNYRAIATSSNSITSNYQSPANLFQSAAISFKFSINGKDNEMNSGTDHHFNCTVKGTSCMVPLVKFGHQFVDSAKTPVNNYLQPDTKFTIRLDMRDVLDAIKNHGYYTTFDGNKIYKEDFKAIYVAGSAAPLIWDFDNLVHHPDLEMKDPDGDGIFETTLTLNETKKEKDLASSWAVTKDILDAPQYHSEYLISDAIYKMALEEMEKSIEPDSTFRTGKEWAGVWTRDISYSIILSMAYMQPGVAKYSLMRKVKNGVIIQDTGTGGAYPCSTDRMIWAVAAWELYKVTGDKDWLRQAYEIIKNSINDDLQNIYDNITGMVRGESSFLDWREQTYPKWMQPADIFESENLGTNAVHYEANMVLSQMASLLKNDAEAKKYKAVAEKIKKGINTHLWMSEKGYYGQYLYGRNFKMLSPKSEALGEALCVSFGIADNERQKTVIDKTPVTAFGITCIYPQIADIPPYHNDAVWPFVQSYWALASAKAGNEKSVLQSISDIYRPAAMFLTNKENFVADNGDYKGTQINSSNMLWSLSGSISLVHKIIFGINFETTGLSFAPFVPFDMKGKRSLSNFTYRKAKFNINMEGYGNKIKSFALDGKILPKAFILSNIEGVHSIEIILANNKLNGSVNGLPNHTSLPTPALVISNNNLSWPKLDGAKEYVVTRNGKVISKTTNNFYKLNESFYSEYQVIAIDGKGYESFASEPLVIAGQKNTMNYEIENFATAANLPYKGYTGKGFVEISKEKNTKLNIPVIINEDGLYALDFRYANGNGPTNTENKCAIRTLKIDNRKSGTFVFPQRGVDEWSNWGFSNPVHAYLKKGKHIITLSFEHNDENMNVTINQAMLDYLRIVKLD
jgi:Bacterial alpha-L-rhamnosidase 6 hairpin glycosidase domain